MNPKTVVLGAGGITVAAITINWVTGQQPGFVPPGRYLSAGVLYSLLYLAAGPVPSLAAVTAAGITLAIILNPFIQAKTPAQIQQAQASFVLTRLTGWLNQLAGQPKKG